MTTTATSTGTTSILDLTDVPPENDGDADTAEGFANGDHGDPGIDPGIYGLDLTPFDSADGDAVDGEEETGDATPEQPDADAVPQGAVPQGDAPLVATISVNPEDLAASILSQVTPAAKLVAQVHRRILRARKVLRLRHAEYLDAKESTKAAKERFSAAQTDLNALIGELCKALTGEGQLPLPLAVGDDPEDEDEDEDLDPADDFDENDPMDHDERDQQPERFRRPERADGAAPAAATAAPAATPDPAKSAPLSVLAPHGLTESKAEKLAEADIRTVADLEACINAGRLMKIKGIGEKAIDKIADAVLAWREKNPAPDEPA